MLAFQVKTVIRLWVQAALHHSVVVEFAHNRTHTVVLYYLNIVIDVINQVTLNIKAFNVTEAILRTGIKSRPVRRKPKTI